MPKKSKKLATEMTTVELAKRVFPKRVVEGIAHIAQEIDAKTDKKSSPK